MNISELNQRFGKSESIKIIAGLDGLPCVQVSNSFADAEVYLQGAHVTKFQPKGQTPLLWMSASSNFIEGKPIRGGIPICWPWFGPHSTQAQFPAHGFARNASWTLDSVEPSKNNGTILKLSLKSGDFNKDIFPSNFNLTYSIEIGAKLTVMMTYTNLSNEDQIITEALHSYFTVSDVRNINIRGLSGISYIDKVRQAEQFIEGQNPIKITSETDRVYQNTAGSIEIHDPGLKRIITVEKSGSNSTVVWNPWIDKSKKMADFGDDEWPGMLCIETANAGANTLKIPADSTHSIGTTLSIRPL